MINRIIILFKIARKIGSSDIIEIVDKSHKVPFFIKLFFNLVSLSFTKNQKKTKRVVTTFNATPDSEIGHFDPPQRWSVH